MDRSRNIISNTTNQLLLLSTMILWIGCSGGSSNAGNGAGASKENATASAAEITADTAEPAEEDAPAPETANDMTASATSDEEMTTPPPADAAGADDTDEATDTGEATDAAPLPVTDSFAASGPMNDTATSSATAEENTTGTTTAAEQTDPETTTATEEVTASSTPITETAATGEATTSTPNATEETTASTPDAAEATATPSSTETETSAVPEGSTPVEALPPAPPPDGDKDGLADANDNCPFTANADQKDLDGDKIGDICDPDWDGDRVVNAKDNCPYVPNAKQEDNNQDSVGDACDGIFDRAIHLAGQLGGDGRQEGPAIEARFNQPRAVAVNGTHLYIGDLYNYTLRKVNLQGQALVSSGPNLAALPNTSGSGTPSASVQNVSAVNGWGMLIDGNILYAGHYSGNSIAVFDVSTDTLIDTIFIHTGCWISGIAKSGDDLFAACYNQHTIYKVSGGTVTLIAGTEEQSGYQDDPFGTEALFEQPEALTICGGRLIVADSGNDAVRVISLDLPHGVDTLAMTKDAEDLPMEQRLFEPTGLSCAYPIVFVSNSASSHISGISMLDESVKVFLGEPFDKGVANTVDDLQTARFHYPEGIAYVDGTMYVADTYNFSIRACNVFEEKCHLVAGLPLHEGDHDGIGATATFWKPSGIAMMGKDLLVAQMNALRKINPVTKEVTTLIHQGFDELAVDGSTVYAVRKAHVVQIHADGSTALVAGQPFDHGYQDGPGNEALFEGYLGIAVDAQAIYAADWYNHVIRRIDKVTHMVETICGAPGEEGKADGACSAARFDAPGGLLVQGDTLYITEIWGKRLRALDLKTMTVSTIVKNFPTGPRSITTDGERLYVGTLLGFPAIFSIDPQTGSMQLLVGADGEKGVRLGDTSHARLNRPWAITFDPLQKQLYVADWTENAVIQLQ
ncbi:MAG: thrombospondin type 3 repeat-containing protein [Deltaproteobacteria bacterium]|nr:thrombospondin type 3 repeat-containing protein [Deltaproteobacteria bacterium]